MWQEFVFHFDKWKSWSFNEVDESAVESGEKSFFFVSKITALVCSAGPVKERNGVFSLPGDFLVNQTWSIVDMIVYIV